MAWNIGDSFDFLNGAGDMILGTGQSTWDSSTGIGLGATANTRFTVGQCLDFYYAGGLQKSVTNNDQEHHLVFAFKRYTGATNDCFACFTLSDGVNPQCSFSLHGDSSIRLYSGTGTLTANGAGTLPTGTLLTTFASALPASIWTGIEIDIYISNTAGYMNVRLNGNTANDYTSPTNLNTRNGSANAYANRLNIYDQGGGYHNGGHSYLDDFLWFTTAGSAPNTWVGDIRAYQLMPTTDATVSMARFPTGNVSNASCVNQAVEDGDTSYVNTLTVGANDLYNLTNLPSTPVSIIAVQTKMMARKTDSGLRQVRAQIKSGATTSNGATITLASSYTYSSKLDVVDPNTGAAWTPAAINLPLQLGPYLVA